MSDSLIPTGSHYKYLFCYFPLGNLRYLVIHKNKQRQIVNAEFDKLSRKYVLEINDFTSKKAETQKYYMTHPIQKLIWKNNPPEEMIEDFVAGKLKQRPIKDISIDILESLRVLWDANSDLDHYTLLGAVIQTYTKNFQNSTVYFAVDGQYGSAKTTILEYLQVLGDRTFLASDISGSGILRIVDQHKANILVDELDQLPDLSRSGVEKILRSGQRRGNSAYKSNTTKNFEVEEYETYGAHSFCFRGTTEDALRSRSLPIRSKKTKNHMVGLLNEDKRLHLLHLRYELFFWYVSKYLDAVKRFEKPAYKLTQLTPITKASVSVDERQRIHYKNKISPLPDIAKEYMKKLHGRNAGIYHTLVMIFKTIQLDGLIEDLGKIMEQKQIDDGVQDDEIREFVQELLVECYDTARTTANNQTNPDIAYRLQKGTYEGCYYYPTKRFYQRQKDMEELRKIQPITRKKIIMFLKEFGFITGETFNAPQQNKESKKTMRVLIFSKDVMRELKLK
jgi:hypothetical protein